MFFSGNLHGDEQVGPMAVVKLIELLLGAYCAPEEDSGDGDGNGDSFDIIGESLRSSNARHGLNLSELVAE